MSDENKRNHSEGELAANNGMWGIPNHAGRPNLGACDPHVLPNNLGGNSKSSEVIQPCTYMYQVANDEVIKSIDRAIEFIHLASTNGVLNHGQRTRLQRLIEHRQSVLQGRAQSPTQSARPTRQPTDAMPSREGSAKRSAPPPPGRTTPVSSPVSSEARDPLSRTLKTVETQTADIETKDQKPFDVPHGLLTEIVEQVREGTGLSFEKSKTAVKVVLSQVAGNVPEVATVMERILESSVTREDDSTSVILEGGKDFDRMETILTELVSCKDDSQQRSWALHEDEAIITEYLEELQSLLVIFRTSMRGRSQRLHAPRTVKVLFFAGMSPREYIATVSHSQTDADSRVCRAVIQKDNYGYLSALALYYQMEPRIGIRLQLLKAFGGICGTDLGALSHLLGTILPVEIARDLKTDRGNYLKMCYSALLCIMLFSSGEQLPFTHYDQLNASFVSFLLDFIEDPPPDEDAEQIPDLFVNVLLSFNLHFQDPSSNILMTVLAQRQQCKSFSEKVMLLVNRGVDPVRVLEHEMDAPDSLLKFLSDVFSSRVTTEIFYTNDMMVLIDIIVRQLTDLSPGDKVRTENLALISKIFENTDYWDHRHRLSELKAVFERILQEEETESDTDKSIIQEMRRKLGERLS